MAKLQSEDSDLVLGVTGHRSIQESDELSNALDRALDAIRSNWPHRKITVLSALAEGADRIVAQHVLSHTPARLVVVLPMDVAEYLEDFPTQQSQHSFQQLLSQADEILHGHPSDARPQAYAAAGARILAHSDVLIALWDGEPARGAGGTGEVVQRSRALGMPLVWIRCHSRGLGAEGARDPGGNHGDIRFERFPS